MKAFGFFLLSIMLLPSVSLAQFTGFQDETVSPIYWSTDNSYQGSSTDIVGSEKNNITTEGAIGSDGSIKNNSGGVCVVANKTLDGYVDFIGCAVRVAVLPFIIALALVSFIWGVTVMMRNPANEEAQKKGRTFILWGIIGFFVITSVYALVAIIRRTVGFGYNAQDDATPYNLLKERALNLK